jgi:hypothetical protein
MVSGISLLFITGFIGISFWNNEKLRRVNAVFFGIGAALILDEFSLRLFLQNIYIGQNNGEKVLVHLSL